MFLLLDNYDSFTWNLYQAIASSLIAKDSSCDPQSAVKVVRNDKISVDEVLDMQPRGIVISPGPGRPENAGISLALIEALLQAKGGSQVDPCLQARGDSQARGGSQVDPCLQADHCSPASPALLGVCLGMQCLAQSCGAKIVRAKKLMHGKISEIKLTSPKKNNGENNGENNARESSRANPLFLGLPATLKATRYHSLVVEPESLPAQLNIDAYSQGDGDGDGGDDGGDDGDNQRAGGEPPSKSIVMALSHKKLDLFGVQFHPESIACEHGTKLLDNFVTFCLDRR